MSERHIEWVHLESKRRLLLACYALEVQQCLFFGSQRPVSDANLPPPCSMALWESRDLNTWLMLAPNDVGGVMSIGDLLSDSNGNDLSQDVFLATTAIAYFTYNPTPWSPEIPAQELLHSIPKSPQCLFAYHASVLAANTPVHDLLAVSGESFVLGEKLATRDQFSQCLSELHAWNTEGTRAETALYHATELLKLSLHSGGCGLMNEDWSLVLASLVCWARIMWPAQKEMAEQVPQMLEVKDVEAQAVTALTSTTKSWSQWQDARPMDWNGARVCLMWARQRIEGHIGWLVQDGVGILQKLVNGRVIQLEQ